MRRLLAVALRRARRAPGPRRPTRSRSSRPGSRRVASAATPNSGDRPAAASSWRRPRRRSSSRSRSCSRSGRRAGAAYGIPWSVLAAINKIESNFGQNMGPSSAGAIGWMQFMPDTWARWGVDANGDGVADPWNAEDAIYSRRALPRSDRRHDRHLARRLRLQPRAVVRRRGAAARAAVRERRRRLRRARSTVRSSRSTPRSRRCSTRAQRLLDAKARRRELQDSARTPPRARGRRTRALLRPARRAEARDARRDSACRPRRPTSPRAPPSCSRRRPRSPPRATAPPAPRSRPARARCSARRATRTATSSRSPAAPGVVSVGHTHHDYPAADIAAPEGTQLYALSDGTVERAWARAERQLRHRLHDRDHGRPDVDVLPPVLPRAGGRRRARSSSAGQPVGLVGADRPRRPGRTSTSSCSRRPPTRRTRRGSRRSPGRPSPGRTASSRTPRSGRPFSRSSAARPIRRRSRRRSRRAVVDGQPGVLFTASGA